MAIQVHLPGYRRLRVFRNAAIRTGVYVGVCLTLVFTAWLVLANRAPLLERLALERNIAAAALLVLIAVVPILRFLRMPGHLLASSLIGWLIFSLSYRILCLIFHRLSDWHSTFQVFMLGAVVYMIVTTLSWIGTSIWKARAAHVSHPKHHAS
jgi:cytochrome bd-type quinol oxidase subunit 2